MPSLVGSEMCIRDRSVAASVEKGILAPDTDEQKKYLDAWEAYTQTDKVVVKFVPASGAASRMFKNLFEFLGADYDTPQTNFEKTFFEKIEKFAFYDDLNTACQRTAGKDILSGSPLASGIQVIIELSLIHI